MQTYRQTTKLNGVVQKQYTSQNQDQFQSIRWFRQIAKKVFNTNSDVLHNNAKTIFIEIIQSPANFLMKNPIISSVISMYMPQMILFYKKLKKTLKYSVEVLPTSAINRFAIQAPVSGITNYRLGYNEQGIKQIMHWFQQPDELLYIIAAARMTFSNLTIYQYVAQSLTIFRDYGTIIPPSGFINLMVDFFIKNRVLTGSDQGQIVLTPNAYKFELFKSGNVLWMIDFLGFQFPSLIFESKTPTTLKDIKGSLQSQFQVETQYLTNLKLIQTQIAKHRKLLQVTVSIIQGQQEKILRRQNEIQGYSISQQVKMKEQTLQNISKQVAIQYKKLNELQVQAEIVEVRQLQISKELIQPPRRPQRQKRKAQIQVQIRTAIKYMQQHLQSFKKKFIKSFKLQQLNDLPQDVRLQIILNQQKRRVKRTVILNQLNSSLLVLRTIQISKQSLNSVATKISAQQANVYKYVQQYAISPKFQIEILLKKGERIQRQKVMLQNIDMSVQKQGKKLEQLITNQAKTIYGGQSKMQQSIKNGIAETTRMINDLSIRLQDNKIIFSNFIQTIDASLLATFKDLNTYLNDNFAQVLDQLKNQITLLQGRLNVQFEQTKKMISQNSLLLKQALSRINQVAKDITNLRFQIGNLRAQTGQINSNTKQILITLQNFLSNLKLQGFNTILDKQNLNKIQQIDNKIKQYNPDVSLGFIQKKVNQSLTNFTPTIQKGSIDDAINSKLGTYQPTIDTGNLDNKVNNTLKTYVPSISSAILDTAVNNSLKSYVPGLNMTSIDTIVNDVIKGYKPQILTTSQTQLGLTIAEKIKSVIQGTDLTGLKTKIAEKNAEALAQLQRAKEIQRILSEGKINYKQIEKQLPDIINALLTVYQGNGGSVNQINSIKQMQAKVQQMQNHVIQIKKILIANGGPGDPDFPNGEGGGGGDGNFKKKLREIQALKAGINIMFRLARTLLNSQTKFVVDMINDLYGRKIINNKQVRQLYQQQIIDRYQNIRQQMFMKNATPYKQFIQQWIQPETSQIKFQWWNANKKRIKIS